MIYQGHAGMWNDWLEFQAQISRSRKEAKAAEAKAIAKRKKKLVDTVIIAFVAVGCIALITGFFALLINF
jgi:hypothetical protein